MKTWIVIALRNISLHWKHSLAAAISIASGLVSLCMFQGYMNDVQRIYIDTFSKAKMFGHIIVENRELQSVAGRSNPLEYSIVPEDQIKIEKYLKNHRKEVVNWTRFLNFSGIISNGNENTIFEGRGFDLESGRIMRGKMWEWDTMYGLPLDHTSHQDAVLLGYSLGKLLGCVPDVEVKMYDPTGGYKAQLRPFHCKNPYVQLTVTTENEQVNAIDQTVLGLIDANYKEVDNKYLQISLENAQQLMDTKKVSYYTLLLDNEDDSDNFIQNFTQYAKENNLNLDVRHWTNHKIGDMYIRTMDLLSVFRNFIVIIILFIAGLSIFNTMVKIVRERMREIGTLRSLGFGRNAIVTIFLYESFLLGIAGVIGGIIFSLVMSSLVNLVGVTYKAGVLTQPVVFKISGNFNLYFVSSIILLTLTLLTSYLAAKQAVRKKIIECLTHA